MGPIHLDEVFYQKSYRYRFDWGETGVRELAPSSSVIVIFDVLSFTTCVNIAVSRGAVVFPYRYKDERARAFAASVDAKLAGPRGETPSLSPGSLETLESGERIVLPSPNGSACTVAASETGATVIAGCLRNASAVARFIADRHQGESVTVIAAGELWPNGALRPSVEDVLGAGALLSQFDAGLLSPEAEIAVGAFRAMESDLESVLRNCVSGRELIAKGFPDDVTLASQFNVSDVVPVLRNGRYERG